MKAGDNLVKEVVIEQLLEKGGTLAAAASAGPLALPGSSPTPPIDDTFADFEGQVFAHLLRRMKSPDELDPEGDRDRAFEALRHFRSSRPRHELAAFLVLTLEEARPSIYVDAAKKLALLGPEAMSALTAGTRSKDAWVRKICIEGLVSRNPLSSDEKAATALTAALGDSNDEVRRAALVWAESRREAPPGGVERLAAWMSPENVQFGFMFPSDRARGAAVLGQWATEPETSVAALIHALDDGYGRKVQLAAVTALRRFGLDGRRAVPQLYQFQLEGDELAARAATDTLAALGLDGRAAVASFLIREVRVHREISARR